MIAHFALLGAALLGAPADTTKTVSAESIAVSAAPEIDGHLSEAAWAEAEAAEEFVQLTPEPGEPATYATEARVLYTDEAIYVGMRMHDPHPDSIAAQLARRDAYGIYSDWAHVVIDSYNDNRTAFRFSVNPRGVKKDVYHFNDTGEDLGWDAVWQVATEVDSAGWTAEFRIPLSQLRFSVKGAEQSWGINFGREIARYDERVYWAPIEPNSDRYVSYAGTLTGLRGLRSPRRLEVRPYTVARLTRSPAESGNPFYDANDASIAIGGDVQYGLTSELTLTATLNPDFGQVEADPSSVNLTAYETFLPEQRPFFVEGTDIFRFGIGAGDGDFGSEGLFYTRRIGRRPQRSGVPGEWADAPETTTILGAAKLSGKMASGWSIGLLNAVTAEERARYVLPGNADVQSITTEPLTNYAVARVIRNFNDGKSALGAIVTGTNRFMDEADGLAFLPSASYAGGVDGRYRFGGGNYELRAWALGSRVEGDSLAIQRLQLSPARYFQRPDGHVAYQPGLTALGGWAASAELTKIGGGNWAYGGILNARSPGFEVNDLGFQREANMGLGAAFAQYQQFNAGPWFRNWRISSSMASAWTFGGERTLTQGNINGGAEFNNFWRVQAGVNRDQESLSTSALRGGPAIIRPGGYNGWFGMNSDRRKRVNVNAFGGWSLEDETDGGSFSVSPSIEWRPSSNSELEIGTQLVWNREAWQFVGSQSLDDQSHSLFANLDQRTAVLTARLNYTFTPGLTLQFYAQPFVSAGEFSNFSSVVDPRGAHFGDRFRPFADNVTVLPTDPETGLFQANIDDDPAPDVAFGNPDFNFKQFNSNAVLRWEYRPGSTLFVVWSQGRQQVLPDGTFGFGRDFGRLFGFDSDFPAPSTNVLLIKFNYWLNL